MTPLIPRARFLLGGAEIAAILVFVAAFAVPTMTRSVLVYSVMNQALVGVVAAQSVWIMLRMNLLSFASPAFMAIGGYTVAIAGQHDITDAFVLTAAAFLLPALVAVPLGALVLRLKGTYFVLVTFVLSQIMQLLLFESPGLTGGSNGISGIPPVTFLGTELATNKQVVLFACGIALLATIITACLTRYFRQHFRQGHILPAQNITLADPASLQRQQMPACDVVDMNQVEPAIDIGRHAALGRLDNDAPRRRRLDVARADRG